MNTPGILAATEHQKIKIVQKEWRLRRDLTQPGGQNVRDCGLGLWTSLVTGLEKCYKKQQSTHIVEITQ